MAQYFVTRGGGSKINQKHSEFSQWVDQFDRMLIESDDKLEDLIQIVKNKVDELNEKYTKSKPIHYYQHSWGNERIFFSAKPEGGEAIAFIAATKIKKIFE